MRLHLLLALLLAAPFWETRTPDQWTDGELEQLLGSSPWVRTLDPPITEGKITSVAVRLATARPIREAESELARRRRQKFPEAPVDDSDDYETFLEQRSAECIILAVNTGVSSAFGDRAEIRRMQEESYLRVGKTRLKMEGHFPPTPADPWLRLVFPRPREITSKSVIFELYIPSLPAPFRQVEFWVDELIFRGKPEL